MTATERQSGLGASQERIMLGDVPEASAAVREPRVLEVGEGSSSIEREFDLGRQFGDRESTEEKDE
jgi:hypothetical protein